MAARTTTRQVNSDTNDVIDETHDMLLQQTRDQLRSLKLAGMLDALEQQLEQPDTHDLSFEERLSLLVEREVIHRENRRLARLLSVAKLRVAACIEDIDYAHPRGLSKSRMASLAQLEWVGSAMNLCITGQTVSDDQEARLFAAIER